jgi:hypothetical protein
LRIISPLGKCFIKLRAFITGPSKDSGDAETGFLGTGNFILVLEYLKDYISLTNYLDKITEAVDKSKAAAAKEKEVKGNATRKRSPSKV